MTAAQTTAAMDKIAQRFRHYGYELYLVGGCVRDMKLGNVSHDLDFATNATPNITKQILDEVATDLWTVGEKFGTIGGIVGISQVEITTYRRNEKYHTTRKPDVEYGDTIHEDLSRRDFTMNAMALDMHSGILIDPYKGARDIERGLIRAVGSSFSRIEEDPLRILRAVRFAAQLGFRIDTMLSNAIILRPELVDTLSQERVFEELKKMLTSPRPSYAMNELKAHDVLQRILPEIAVLAGIEQNPKYHDYDVYDHTMQVLERVPATVVMRLAALFHDSGKANTREFKGDGRVTFYGHEFESAKIADKALRRLKAPNDIRESVMHLCRHHMRPLGVYRSGMSDKAVRKLIRAAYNEQRGLGIDHLLDLHAADMQGHKDDKDIREKYTELFKKVGEIQNRSDKPIEALQSPLDGHEIMALFPQLKPGEWIASTKNYLTDLVVCGTLHPDDREMAVKEAMWHVSEISGGPKGNYVDR